MFKLSTTAQEGIKESLKGGIVHNYVLNDRKASKVLLSNAKISMAETISDTLQTTQLQLSTGAFSQVLFPLISYWKSFPSNQVLIQGESQAVLKEVRIDEEVNGKKVDALTKLVFHDKKISLFAYCTNQTIMIQGVNHREFLAAFLMPVLKKNFSEKKDSINQYNQMVIKALSASSLELDDSVWSSTTPDRLKMKIKRSSVPCESCGKEYANVSRLKVHLNNAHSDKTRAKPRVPVKSSRKLVSVVPMQPGSQAPSFPVLTYDADSELLLDEGDDSDVDILENDQTPVGNTSGQSTLDAPAQGLEVQEVGTTADILGPPSKGMEAKEGMEEQEVHPKPADPPLARPEDSSETSIEVVETSSAQAEETTPVVIEANITVQDHPQIQTVSEDFQCAVCQKCFETQGEVMKHFEDHGNGETIITLMKEIHILKSNWERKFDAQQLQVSSLQHNLHVLQVKASRASRPDPSQSSRPDPPSASRPAKSPASRPTAASPSTSSSPAPASPPASTRAPSTQPARRQPPAQPSSRQAPVFRPAPATKGKRRVLYIRDSIHRTIVGPKLENPTGSLIRCVNAYASVRDERAPANKQHLNVNSVVRRELAKNTGEDTLVLGAPSVDITNQDTSEGIMDEHMTETIASSMAMLEAAEYALKTNKVKQVIILEHLPRYDVDNKDKDKAELARMANAQLHKARNASEYEENILVGRHTGLECEGVTRRLD